MEFDANGWLDEAIEIDCLENTSSRNGRAIKYVVQHGTAGGSSAEAIGNFYKSTVGGNNPVSTHFIIGKDGHIVQCVPLTLAAWANGAIGTGHAPFIDESFNPNEDTASIEYVKNQVDANGVPDNSDELTDAQKLAGFRLNKCICETYNVPKRAGDVNGGIIAHHDIDPVNRSRCPGNFPWQELFDYLNNGGNTNMGIPQGWKDDGKTLTAPNGITVALGFRDHILADPTWSPDNWPLEAEKHLTGLEMSNPSLGDGQSQIFRSKRLEYTAKMGVFEGWLGVELLWYQKQVSQVVAQVGGQVADLEKQITALQHPQPANLVQINTIGKQIADDVALILKLSQAQ